MNKSKILRVVLIAVLTLVATTASAHDFEVDGIFYNYNGDGTVSVTYKGSYYDSYADRYTGDVVIPSSVTYSGTTYSVKSIGDNAFSYCSGLTSVTIPNSVTSIDNYAFYYCSGLKSITIPNSVTSIGNSAFYYCSGLKSITIPNSVTSIGNYAFSDCSGLTRVVISSIEAWLGIKFSTYSSNPLYYAKHLYLNGEEVKDLVIPNSVTSIGNYAFSNCSGLTSVSIPNSVTSIGDDAFAGCSGLTSVTIPNSVKFIGDYAFQDCSGLTSVSIPNSVTSIGVGAFYECRGLTRVDISSIEAWLGIKFAGKNPLYYAHHLYLNGEEVKDLVIPNSVTSIGDRTFQGCSGLTSVTIPNSVNSIGESAFSDCSGLESIEVESGNSTYDSRDNCNAIIETATNTLLAGCNNTIIPNSVTSIGGFAFEGCSGLSSVTIPNSVTSIGRNAFWYCSGLSSVTIPNSVTSIGNWAFKGCSGLTSVTIPNSVTSIGNLAFSGCSGLTRVDISSLEAWLGIKFGNSTSNPLYHAHHLYLNGEELKDLVIPNSVTSIGSYAFSGCSGLTSVTIPNSISSIGKSAFEDCDGLTSVTIPNSVTSIGGFAFEGCSGLTSVTSKAVTPPTCGSGAFSTETYSVPLIVPSIAKEAYKAASTWSDFSNYAEPESKITNTSFNYNESYVVIGNTLQLNVKVTPVDATFADVLQWTSSNPEVATVDNNGLVTTLALGSTVITATSCDGSNISATCTVVVCPKAANVNELVSGANNVGFGLQGVKMHDGVLYACTTTESVNKSTPTFHSNNANNMAPYEDRNFDDFDQRDWVAIRGLEGDFEGKELSYPFVANFADGVLTPSETISATADATAYNLNTFRAENILHGGYNNYAEGDYKAYYVPARVNEVAKFMGLIETVGGTKYLYSNNTYGRKDGEGIKVENCTIADNSDVYSILEGILVADKLTKAGVKIIMLDYLGQATGVEGVDSAAARIYSSNGNIIIAAAEDGEAAVYDYTGRLIKSVPVVAGDNTAVPVMPGCYIVRTGVKTQSVVVK